MKRYSIPLLLALAANFLPVSAQTVSESADVYLCVGEKGQREYKNTGNVKGCKKVELLGLTVVPAVKPRPAAGNAAANTSGNAAGNAAASTQAAKPAASSPVDFPKVDSSTQKVRDNDRKQIWQDELKAEEEKLNALKKQYNDGEPERRGDEANFAKYQERVAKLREDIARTEKNVEALKRELSGIK